MNTMGPHKFKPVGKIFHRNRCIACYLDREKHPTTGYTTARPVGDKGEHPMLDPKKEGR